VRAALYGVVDKGGASNGNDIRLRDQILRGVFRKIIPVRLLLNDPQVTGVDFIRGANGK